MSTVLDRVSKPGSLVTIAAKVSETERAALRSLVIRLRSRGQTVTVSRLVRIGVTLVIEALEAELGGER